MLAPSICFPVSIGHCSPAFIRRAPAGPLEAGPLDAAQASACPPAPDRRPASRAGSDLSCRARAVQARVRAVLMSASSFALSHSLKKEMPAFRRASPPRYDETLLIPVLRLTGLLARLARLLVGLLVLGAAVARAVDAPAAADRAPVATAADCVPWGRSSLALHSQRRRPGLDAAAIGTPPWRNGLPVVSWSPHRPIHKIWRQQHDKGICTRPARGRARRFIYFAAVAPSLAAPSLVPG